MSIKLKHSMKGHSSTNTCFCQCNAICDESCFLGWKSESFCGLISKKQRSNSVVF